MMSAARAWAAAFQIKNSFFIFSHFLLIPIGLSNCIQITIGVVVDAVSAPKINGLIQFPNRILRKRHATMTGMHSDTSIILT